MEYQLLRFKLDHLCDLTLGGLLALPDFQRDFVWTAPKIVDLLQSIAREWPIGSLLILEGPSQFACKSIELGPHVSQPGVKYYILDGQQRITSIYHAIRDLSDYVYYVDFKKLISDSLDEDFIFFTRRKSFEKEYPTLESAALAGIARISDVYDTEKFIEWISNIGDPGTRRDYAKIRKTYIYGLNAGVYSIPATVLPKDVHFTALAKIFEGLNTSSVRLTTSDLLVAANLPKGVNLRELWAEFSEKNEEPELLNLDLLDVLKVSALMEIRSGSGRIKGLKQSDLIKVDPEIYRNNWKNACAMLIRAAEYAADKLGVLNKAMLPSTSNLIALSFVLEERVTDDMAAKLWLSWALRETFSQSSHTRLLTELNPQRSSTWHEPSSLPLDMLALEIDLAMQKTCGSSSYLNRGVNSLRSAIALHSDPESKKKFLLDKTKMTPYIEGTNYPPKKDSLIRDVRVGRKEGAVVLPTSAGDMEINSENFSTIFESVWGACK